MKPLRRAERAQLLNRRTGSNRIYRVATQAVVRLVAGIAGRELRHDEVLGGAGGRWENGTALRDGRIEESIGVHGERDAVIGGRAGLDAGFDALSTCRCR